MLSKASSASLNTLSGLRSPLIAASSANLMSAVRCLVFAKSPRLPKEVANP